MVTSNSRLRRHTPLFIPIRLQLLLQFRLLLQLRRRRDDVYLAGDGDICPADFEHSTDQLSDSRADQLGGPRAVQLTDSHADQLRVPWIDQGPPPPGDSGWAGTPKIAE